MNIDKNRFLLLTTALAATTTAVVLGATGCETTATDTDAGLNDSGTLTDSGTVILTDSSTSDASDGGTCLGNTGAAPLCSPDEDAGDGGGYAQCPDECTILNQKFKTEVARTISTCLDNSLLDASAEGCFDSTESCIKTAVDRACDDTEATPFCTTFLSGCDDAGTVPTQAQCVAIVRAMNAEGKTALSTCTEEGLTCNECLDGVLMKQ